MNMSKYLIRYVIVKKTTSSIPGECMRYHFVTDRGVGLSSRTNDTDVMWQSSECINVGPDPSKIKSLM